VEGPLSGAAGPLPAAVLLLALVLDAYVGDAPRIRALPVHPAALLDRWIALLDSRLDRSNRGSGVLRVRGWIALIVVAGPAAAIGVGIDYVAAHSLLGWTLEVAVLVMAVACRGTHDRARHLQHALAGGSLEAARRAVVTLTDRDPAELDEYGVARAGVESLARTLDRGLVAPVLFFALLGLPGVLALWAVRRLAAFRAVSVSEAYAGPARRVARFLAWLPRRAAAFLIAAAALARPDAAAGAAIKASLRVGRGRGSERPIAAMAGALGLALGGPRRYPGRIVDRPWLGEGRARADARDIARALGLYRVAWALVGGVAAAILVVGWAA